MTDRHLGTPRHRRLAGAVAPLVAATLLAATLVSGCQAPASPTPTPADDTGGTPRPSATATVTPPPTKTTPTKVAASELRRIAVPGVGFDQAVTPMSSVEMGNAIDPPKYAPGRPSTPVRVSDKGVQPSSDAGDTVYVGCHTSASNGAEKYPCNVLIRALRPGDKIVASTDAGTVTYAVSQTRSIPYGEFAGDEQTWAVVPRRLVFVVCDVLNGTPTHANYVVYATVT